MYNEISEKIAAFFKDRKEVIAVYLFGSYARRKERSLSDIDIAVLLDRMDRSVVRVIRNRYIIELSRLLRKDIHLVIMNSTDEVLIRQIFSKGKCIHVSDSKKLAHYRMVMFAKIVDFEYYRCQMQSGFITKVMEG